MRAIPIASLALVTALVLPPPPVSASSLASLPPTCSTEMSPGGSVWLLCPPSVPWNGDLVVFAHGYVAPDEPLTAGFDQLVLPDGTTIPGLVNSMGYLFAASSYPKNGLAVREGVADTKALVEKLRTTLAPNHVYLVGASEGGLVAALAVERYPELFSGGLSTCGPIGDFRDQIDYVGDVRVVFDYFFPKVLPRSPVSIPAGLVDGWYSTYAGRVAAAMAANPAAASALLTVTGAATDPGDPLTGVRTAQQVLWYNVFATNEARIELGGQPFDNRKRVYAGSSDDARLNHKVERFKAASRALGSIAADYRTSGSLLVPLVTMHTTGDPVVPFWHEELYTAKTIATGSDGMHVNIEIARYGHCNFTTAETLAAFALLVSRVTGQQAIGVQSALPDGVSDGTDVPGMGSTPG
jgi:pimeloyl-ACP methyl ester carboxylesterase